jgi:hypothetical protein
MIKSVIFDSQIVQPPMMAPQQAPLQKDELPPRAELERVNNNRVENHKNPVMSIIQHRRDPAPAIHNIKASPSMNKLSSVIPRSRTTNQKVF